MASTSAPALATKEMCFECFDVLLAHISGPPSAVPPPPRYADHTCPFFVTWETSRGSILRGCIGTLNPRRLRGGLGEYALLAGTRDSRFEPVTTSAEVERLAVKVSLLHSYEALPTTETLAGVVAAEEEDDDDASVERRLYDWDLDAHGVTCEFFEPSGDRRFLGSATYLPGVARAQGWTKRQTIESLAAKAGVDVARFGTRALLRRARAVRYRSSVARATHEEYRARSAAARARDPSGSGTAR